MRLALAFLLLVLGMVKAAAPPAENEQIAMEDRSPDTVELLSLPTTNDEDHEGLAKEKESFELFDPHMKWAKCQSSCRVVYRKCMDKNTVAVQEVPEYSYWNYKSILKKYTDDCISGCQNCMSGCNAKSACIVTFHKCMDECDKVLGK